jgi:Kae1-associated kinase Bud32
MAELEKLAMGAEATIYLGNDPVLGKDVIKKTRHPKSYRNPQLDQQLRKRRTRNEAKLLHQAKSAGVKVPFIYDIDMEECSITMEYIEGERLRDVMNAELARVVGGIVGRLHSADIIHGDLTTSNMLLTEKGVVLIDLSLGEISEDLEAKGVDLHVLAENVKAIHTGVDFSLVIEGYKEVHDIPIMEKIQEIESRGRYLKKVE